MTPLSQRTRRESSAAADRFRSLVEVTSAWIWETDENAAYTYGSPKVRDILGYISFVNS